MVFCSVFKIIKRNDTKFLICGSQTPIFFNFGFFKARIQKIYQSETIYFAQRYKKKKTRVLSDSKNVKNDEKHQSWSRISLLGCILHLLPAHPPSILDYDVRNSYGTGAVTTLTWTNQLAFEHPKLFWIPKLQVITGTYTELWNGNFFLNAHVSKEQQKEQLMKGWDFGILNSSGPAALLIKKRASASYFGRPATRRRRRRSSPHRSNSNHHQQHQQ